MTRIPHDSAELEQWFSNAKKVDQAFAPGPAELDHLAVRLSSGQVGATSHGLAALGAPAAKVALGVSMVALAGGVALSLKAAPDQRSATVAASPAQSVALAEPVRPLPSPAAPIEPSLESSEPPVLPAPHSAVPSPRIPAAPRTATPTWTDVNEALTDGDIPAARGALQSFISQGDGAAKERAELALAQLELRGPHAVRAQAVLKRLATKAKEPSVRSRAKSLLSSSP